MDTIGILGAYHYISHGHCYLWQRPLIAIQGVGDVALVLACFSIPATVFYLIRQRQFIRQRQDHALGSPQELETLNQKLAQEYDALAHRFQERTTALGEANQHLQRLAAQARTTACIIQRIRRSLDLQEIFATATGELRRALTCDRVLVYRIDPQGSGTIVAETVTAGWPPCLDQLGHILPDPWACSTPPGDRCTVRLEGNSSPQLQAICIQDAPEQCYQQGIDFVQVADVQTEHLHPCHGDLLQQLQARAYVTVPIYCGDTLWGLLASYQNDGPRQWDDEEVQMVVQVGSQLGVAIQQAELLNRTQQQAAELKAAKDAADAANRAKGDFLASMSHELRTPLNAILGFTQLMARDGGLPPPHRRYVDIVNNSGEHLLGLINNVLDMSKIEAGRLQRCDSDFQLGPCLQNIQAMLGLKAQQKGLAFYLEQSMGLPEWICADEGKLRQILLNLLGNAIKFTTTGHVRLRVNWESPGQETPQGSGSEFSSQPKPMLRLQVEDTGPGLTPQELAVLFKPFQQTEAGLRSGQGTGLGLSLSHRYVQLMGGQIQVDSTLGQGTCFTITLPVSASTPPPGPHPLEQLSGTPSSRPRATLPPLTTTHFQGMPSPWVQAVHQAASQGSDTRIKVLINAIPPEQSVLAQRLLELASVYQFDRILAATTPLQSQFEVATRER